MNDTRIERPQTEAVLATLKPFQRDTVDYVFRRMYTDPDCTRRFLVADEVGLGKTLVARGLIARAIEHLQGQVERVDIVYICSNADIARQNLQRLNLTGERDAARVGRLTMLPALLPQLDARLNFVAFTPGTSFNMGSSGGRWEERALLYWMLEELGRLPHSARGSAEGQSAAQLFQGGVSDLSNWKNRLRECWLPGIGYVEIERALLDRFSGALEYHSQAAADQGETDLQTRIHSACTRLKGRHIHNVDKALWRETQAIIGELRALLAQACLSALEPDLVILDEFQRFKELLDPDNPAGELAHGLFDYAEDHVAVRTLLLSATPYKMYTLNSETESDDHYRDFMATLRFLYDSNEATSDVSDLIRRMRRALYRIPAAGPDEALMCRDELEARLCKVMVRTERAAGVDSGDDMLSEVRSADIHTSAQDAAHYLALQRAVRAVTDSEMVEYWKSAPYLLNFMDQYKVKQAIREALEVGRNSPLTTHLRQHEGLLLGSENIARYDSIDPANPRLRTLMEDVFESGLWRMAWLPPSLASYRLKGAYAESDHIRLTKRLIFSAWHVVPKTIAGLMSYEAERRLHKRFDSDAINNQEARSALARPLRLDVNDGRPSGLPLFTLLYPSQVLAEAGGRALASAAREAGEDDPTLEAVMDRAKAEIRPLLAMHLPRNAEGRVEEAWYWVMPLVLDLSADETDVAAWWTRCKLASKWSGDESEANATGWNEHLERARRVIQGWRPEGPPPDDLVELLAEVAIAGPATSALRSLRAVTEYEVMDTPQWLRDGAARIGWIYRRLFNQIEISVLVRGEYVRQDALPYWRKVLRYALDGGLGAVNDEYFHVLAEATAAGNCEAAVICGRIVEAFEEATALPPSRVEWDEIVANESGAELRPRRRLRTHFALRFGQAESDEGGEPTRADQVRAAFNSPFWPFVLASTSVGQEGLDFHPYCHAIVHWNLPGNPVDMEQREGRVHRHKGHAVRKNVARLFGHEGNMAKCTDRWRFMFERAKEELARDSRGLVPEWNYPIQGGARVERHVPLLPFSRDVDRFERLRRSLAAYRMVFGQARQEDLVAYLLSQIDADQLENLARRLRIDLTPPSIEAPMLSPHVF